METGNENLQTHHLALLGVKGINFRRTSKLLDKGNSSQIKLYFYTGLDVILCRDKINFASSTVFAQADTLHGYV